MCYALSYAAQQVSGVWSWERDTEHIEKAFDFAGMGARNGVTAVTMVQAGFTGVPDVLDGEHNVLQAFSTEPQPEQMVPAWAVRYFVTETRSKVFSVGYPIQAPLDCLPVAAARASASPSTTSSGSSFACPRTARASSTIAPCPM
jgi:2-methylcitrate dehydratase PrpD